MNNSPFKSLTFSEKCDIIHITILLDTTHVVLPQGSRKRQSTFLGRGGAAVKESFPEKKREMTACTDEGVRKSDYGTDISVCCVSSARACCVPFFCVVKEDFYGSDAKERLPREGEDP